MSRFLFTVWPFPGHLHPNLAVARALAARGHEIGFYTGRPAREQIQREGWSWFPFERVCDRLAAVVGAGPDAGEDGLYARLMHFQTRPFGRGLLRRGLGLAAVYRRTILGTVPDQVEDLRAILRSWRPDVLVTDPDMWGPFLVLHDLERVAVGIFSYYAACLVPGSDAPPLGFGLASPRHWRTRILSPALRVATRLAMTGVRRDASRIRRRYGLPPLRGSIAGLMGRMPLHLVASAPEFDYGRRDVPASVHYVGPCAVDGGNGERSPPWLDSLGDPLVYVSEGTTYVGRPRVLEAAARGLGGMPASVLMTTGRHRDPDALGLRALAPNVRVERWVPHSAVFARARVFVTHGGAVSVLGGLSAGVPLVVVPLQWEQADNAQRVVEAGAGVRLDPGRCTPARMRKAVLRVLENPSYRQRARALAGTLASHGGPARAAALLEQLDSGGPVPPRPAAMEA